MRHVTVILASLLLLAAGCSHSPRVRPPTLPASHARLSMAFDLYERSVPESDGGFTPPESRPFDEPSLVVEPAQARAVFDEVVQVLRARPDAEAVRRALGNLHAACDAELPEACAFIKTEFKAPRRIGGPQMGSTNEALAKRTLATVVVHCQLGPDGHLQDCTLLERGPHGLTETVLAYVSRARYQPATLAGHPLPVSYTLTFDFNLTRQTLTPAQRLQWARARTERFPQSPPAWAALAIQLARVAPEDPALAQALGALHKLSPSFWWSANELAWLHVQAGRHEKAAPLARSALGEMPNNPYVLETSAAVRAATGRCEQALAEQRRAVEKLPPEWPAPERERFTRTLEAYQRQCAAPAPEQPRG